MCLIDKKQFRVAEQNIPVFKVILDGHFSPLKNTRLFRVNYITNTVQFTKDMSNSFDTASSLVNGSVKDLTNYENYDNSITFIQYQSGSMGLNLQKANKIIYFTPTLSSEMFEQSKKRIHRLGQKESCFYYKLVCGIEYKIYNTLSMRKDFTDELFEED